MKKKFNKNSNYSMAHVLYQKLGNDWFAFTEVDGDCFMSKVDASKIDAKTIEEANNKNSESTNSSDSSESADNFHGRKRIRAA